MARFTVRLEDDGLGNWVEQEADARERSKAWVIRQAVAAAAGRESVYTDAHRTGAHRTDATSTDADRTDPRQLEDRVDALEAAVFDTPTRQEPQDVDATPAPQDVDETELQDVMPDGSAEERIAAAVEAVAEGWSDPEDRLAQRIAAATAVLDHAVREQVAVGKSDALEEFYDEHAVDGQNEETWWRKNVREVLSEYGDYSNGAHGYRVALEDLPEVSSQ